MTDIHDNDDTPSRGHERINFDLNPDYNEYGIESLDDGVVILRIESEKHLFERVGAIRCKQTGIVLQRFLKGETLEDEGSFKTVKSISVKCDNFESLLQDIIVEFLYEYKIPENKSRDLLCDLTELINISYHH